MPSSEFRKRYASLTDRTTVTANGHVIGEWVPVNAPVRQMTTVRLATDEDVVDFGLGTSEQQADAAARLEAGVPGTTIIEPGFNSRPFTPVPKKGK